MHVLLIKKERTTTVNNRQKVVSKGNEWLIPNNKDFHTSDGIITTKQLQTPGKHELGKETYYVLPAQPIDEYRARKQEVQKINLKDLGFISAYIGLHKDMHIGEAGTGSAGATTYFAQQITKVTTYDIREVPARAELQNYKNVEVHQKDIIKDDITQDGPFDAFLLDVPEPWNAWHNMQAVKIGGWIIGYTPSTNQLQKLVNTMPENFIHIHACEVIERHWRVKGLVCRPETADHSHTAFLSFFRRIT